MMLAEQKRSNHYLHNRKGTTMTILLQTEQMSDVLKPKGYLTRAMEGTYYYYKIS